MSRRARRVPPGVVVQALDWARGVPLAEPPHVTPTPAAAAPAPDVVPVPPPAPLPPPEPQRDLAALEREAFSKGFSAGERAGLEAGQQRADGMLRRLAQTLDDVAKLRRDIIDQTERQLVELSLMIARRVLHREATMDGQLVGALAHVALDRLGLKQGPATIRLHPEDHRQVTAHRGVEWEAARFEVVADPSLARGSCIVESNVGTIDAGLDAQLAEVSRALLGEGAAQRPAA